MARFLLLFLKLFQVCSKSRVCFSFQPLNEFLCHLVEFGTDGP